MEYRILKYILLSLVLLASTKVHTQCSDTVQTLADHLAQYPESDTNGDGLLCQHEYVVHQALLYKLQTLEMLEGQVICLSDLEYATVGDTSLVLDLWLPFELDPENKPKLVLWIHGGGWRTGSKDQCLLAWLATHNFAIASVEFRSVGDKPFPANVHDIKGAIRWLRKNAATYDYKAERVGIGGSSSGGHLAALVGTSGDVPQLEGTVGGNLEQSSRVEAAFDVAGVIDILTWRDPPGVITSALGVNHTEVGVDELVALSNPATHLTDDDPPFLIYHGQDDVVVNVEQAQNFHDTLIQEGLESSLHILDVGHLSPLFFNGERADTIVAFFSRALMGEAGPSSVLDAQSSGIVLHQNYPNPLSNSTEIGFELTEASQVIFRVLDMSGKQIKKVDKLYGGGKHSVTIHSAELPQQGVYFYQLQVGSTIKTKQFLFLN